MGLNEKKKEAIDEICKELQRVGHIMVDEGLDIENKITHPLDIIALILLEYTKKYDAMYASKTKQEEPSPRQEHMPPALESVLPLKKDPTYH